MLLGSHNKIKIKQDYWRSNTRLIRWLLCIWAFSSLVCSILLVEPLNKLRIGHVPLGFWMAQQGSIYIFVALVFTYALMMDNLDRRYGSTQNNASKER